MLTDSRSFLSYPRHEYFRRIVCRLFGEWVKEGFFPDDIETLSEIVSNISYHNAKKYFDKPRGASGKVQSTSSGSRGSLSSQEPAGGGQHASPAEFPRWALRLGSLGWIVLRWLLQDGRVHPRQRCSSPGLSGVILGNCPIQALPFVARSL